MRGMCWIITKNHRLISHLASSVAVCLPLPKTTFLHAGVIRSSLLPSSPRNVFWVSSSLFGLSWNACLRTAVLSVSCTTKDATHGFMGDTRWPCLTLSVLACHKQTVLWQRAALGVTAGALAPSGDPGSWQAAAGRGGRAPCGAGFPLNAITLNRAVRACVTWCFIHDV